MARCGWAVAAGLLGLLTTRPVGAEPQGNVAATVGATLREGVDEVRVHLGGRGDVLFGRSSHRDFGVGPYAEVMTAWDDLSVGGGGSLLIPVHEYLPIVGSVGGYGRRFDGGWEPGLTAQVFWGSRSFNYHGWYGMTVGLSVQARVGVGEDGERGMVVALHMDGQALALPFLMAYGAFGGGAE
jgi:hypothetical protein